ncbi:hypothetical protein GCM10028803_21970 [Larkinella knui]|uniref:Uncharacterized protein n=1 Tax=Larkinella knui TaxID=2025310 RepID=A0A3P1CVH1_9BACT|nr:hypothetical protein [Larkinella knui]RRB17273.1 hypothetical protein EHT87_03035 [Larkinella knui]
MESTLQYPVFEADQVLTNRHLNELFTYLDDQSRFTRTHLVGIGIVCGLNLTYNGSDQLTISAGCGVTSLGYLVQFEGINAKHCRVVDQLPVEFAGFNKGYSRLSGWELVEAAQTDTLPLSKIFLDDHEKIVMLLFEADQNDLRNCDTTDCSDKGQQVKFRVRPLLVNRREVETFFADQLKAGLEERFSLNDLHLKRFNVPFSTLQSAADVLTAFRNQILDLDSVPIAIEKLYTLFKPFLNDSIAPELTKIKAYREAHQDTFRIQYVVDLVDDLIRAYHELRDKAQECLTVCRPDETLFPYHLLLGKATVSTDDGEQNPALLEYRPFRTYFLPSPANTGRQPWRSELRMLFTRLTLMVSQFTVPEPPDVTANKDAALAIKVTPSSLGTRPLSERAIPYYYLPQKAGEHYVLHRYWNYQKSRAYRADTNLSYQAERYTAVPAVIKPLEVDIEPYNFFRIEGHIGLPYQTVLARLARLRKDNRLPFDLIALRAGTLPDDPAKDPDPQRLACECGDWDTLLEVLDGAHLNAEKLKQLKDQHEAMLAHNRSRFLFKNYAELHPALEHKAGVVRGGTFVIVYADNRKGPARGEAIGNGPLSTTPGFVESDFQVELRQRINTVTKPEDLKFLREILGLNLVNYFTDVKPAIADGIVFADFYLPYRDTSPCGSVSYQINEPKPSESEKPDVFGIKQTVYCWKDQTAYEFGIDDTFNVEELQNPDELKFVPDKPLQFVPQEQFQRLADGTIDPTDKKTKTFRLTYRSKTVYVTVKVPNAAFTVKLVKVQGSNEVQIRLVAEAKNLLSYRWKIQPEEFEISHAFETTSKPIPMDKFRGIIKGRGLGITLTVEEDFTHDQQADCSNELTRMFTETFLLNRLAEDMPF